jgi:UDP-2,3-diacylglucosamine hydrolase
VYCREVLDKKHYDYFIFGHRHMAIDFHLNERARYINLGEWMHQESWACWDGEELTLMNPAIKVDAKVES